MFGVPHGFVCRHCHQPIRRPKNRAEEKTLAMLRVPRGDRWVTRVLGEAVCRAAADRRHEPA